MAKGYTDPNTVISPKKMWTLLTVLYESPEREDGWSLALGQWDGQAVLGLRWNGNKKNPLGNPTSHGMPTWFIVPDDLNSILINRAGPEARKLVKIMTKWNVDH